MGLRFGIQWGEVYSNGNVASVMPKRFQTMSTDTVTWTVHNNMEEAEGHEEARVIGSYRQRPWSG